MAEAVTAIWKPLCPSRREIRLLYLDPPTSANRTNDYELSGRLTTVSLDSTEPDCQYYAISHAWGSAQAMYPLYIDGMRLLITESIIECLDIFRARRPGAAFWIDAVCINQQDLGERAAQVQLMRYVFSQAMEVWVWLGSKLSPVRELVRGIRGAEELPSNLTSEHGKRFICQVSLFNQLEWWHRVWTVQEVVLSKDVRLWYSGVAVTVSDLWSWRGDVLDLMKRQQGPGSQACDANQLTYCLNHIGRLRSRQMLLLRMQSRQTAMREIELLCILADSRAASSLDVRDRVYGQLAIFEAVLQRGIVRPDYTMSARNAFISFAFEWFRANGSLNLLNQVSSSRNSMQGLPTWVPDWSSRDSFRTELHRLNSLVSYRATRIPRYLLQS